MSSNWVPVSDRSAVTSGLLEANRKDSVNRQPLKSPSSAVRVGVVGYGYWGPNIVRNFHSVEHCEVVAVCDKRPDALRRAQRAYPGMTYTTDLNAVLTSPDIDAIAIVTPVWTH